MAKVGKVGRPVAFESPDDMVELMNEYFDQLGEKETPTFAGFAAFCNVGERTIYDYAKKDGFSQSLESMKSKMKRWWLDNAAYNEINPTIAKLVLSANFEMAEKNVTEHQGEGLSVTIKYAGSDD